MRCASSSRRPTRLSCAGFNVAIRSPTAGGIRPNSLLDPTEDDFHLAFHTALHESLPEALSDGRANALSPILVLIFSH
jgi:hypothetical protein